jgi:hypothetical protein
MADRLVEVFPDVARIAAELVQHPEVTRRWSDESACAGMTVGGLAFHLAGQCRNAVRLLSAAPHDEDPISALEHYRRAAWAHSAPDDEANVTIREAADAEAADGPEALAAQARADLEALPAALAPVLAGERTPDSVLIPWQGWSLTAHDLVLTRTMEALVHSDDLAASVDLPTPRFPDDAAYAVLALLSAVASDRHGQAAVLRVLSRPQRAGRSAAAF